MTLGVLVAMSDRWESAVVTALDRSPGLAVVRRCADLADLLAAAAAGLAQVALVSADLRGLDRSCTDQLTGLGLAVVGMHGPGDDAAERRLRQLGVEVLSTDLAAEQLAARLEECAPPVGRPGAASEDGLPGPGGESGRLGAPTGHGSPDRVPAGRWTPGQGRLDERSVAQIEEALAGAGDPGSGDDADPDRPGTVVAVWGPAGSPGRTTLAVNLAAELACLGSTVVLVDADTYGGCVAQTLSLLDEAPGIAAATRAAEHGTLDLPTLARLAPEVSARLRVLTGIPKAERWTELRPAALEQVLLLTRRLARWTVIDCGFSLENDEELSYDTVAPRRNAATLTALAAADQMVAVGAGDPIGLQRLVRGLQELGTVPSPRPLVVVNKVRAGAVGKNPERRIGEALARFAGVDDLRFVPADPATMDATLLAGRSLAEAAAQTPLRHAVARLALELAAADQADTTGRTGPRGSADRGEDAVTQARGGVRRRLSRAARRG